tara:strand:- start:13619 stop:13828 length:210 start_codon:yes stop_codon:yes gene_type:complete
MSITSGDLILSVIVMNMMKTSKINFLKKFKRPSKQMFWAWITYQTIKGSLTTSFIWIPLFWIWFGFSDS